MPRPFPVQHAAAVAAIFLAAVFLRTAWLTADPPARHPVGIVWHDEGAWTHNARNRALWGAWRTDEWNPVFIAPVFTAFEYAAFREFGVGTWQARTVPVASGLVALALLMAGLSALAGRRAALMGGVLMATEFTWVMWNRAALMESTMTAFVVTAWAAYAMASRKPVWGLMAGAAAALAWFTKASAAFFVAAIAVDALATLAAARGPGRRAWRNRAVPPSESRAALLTLAGLAAAGGAIAVAFVWPHWTEYWFYNVQMSVQRKPTYDMRSLVERASWLPVVQDIFTRMWPLLAAAALAIAGVFARWRDARPAERLLVLWVLLGFLELTVHDSGTERRYVMFIPALIALASQLLGSGAAWLSPRAAAARLWIRIAVLPLLIALAYVVVGSALRPALLGAADSDHPYALAVRTSAALAALAGLALWLWWTPIVRWFSARPVPPGAATALVGLVVVWNLGQYARWAAYRGDENYRASAALGRLLPPGTLVQGKLANGLALENRIRPVFVGRGFGNYADRFDRDDVRYILTYDLPSIGFESQQNSGLIQEILDRYPDRQTIATFDVDETPGHRAVLIDKHPGSAALPGPDRARD